MQTVKDLTFDRPIVPLTVIWAWIWEFAKSNQLIWGDLTLGKISQISQISPKSAPNRATIKCYISEPALLVKPPLGQVRVTPPP